MFVVMMVLVLISRDIGNDDGDDGKLCWWDVCGNDGTSVD